MKKLLLLPCIALMLSCGKKKAEEARLKQEKWEAMKEQAEIAKKEAEDLAIIAWGDAKFGISKEEAKKIDTFADGTLYDSKKYTENYYPYIHASTEYRNNLRKAYDLNISIRDFDLEFDGKTKDELWRVYIRSHDCDSSKRDKLEADVITLVKQFAQKYGTDVELNEDFAFYDISLGDRVRYARWKSIGTYDNGIVTKAGDEGIKLISIYIGKTRDYDYYYEIFISNTKYPTEPWELSDSEKKAKEAESETMNNTRQHAF